MKPDSVLHARVYAGLADGSQFAHEFKVVREKYGSLKDGINSASAADFPTRNTRVRATCQRLSELRAFLRAHTEVASAKAILDELFPRQNEQLGSLRGILQQLIEENGTPAVLYTKFIDYYMRTLPAGENTVRVMTLMGSKGLEADHVYILGCNSGHLPGRRWSQHLSDHEHLRNNAGSCTSALRELQKHST